MSTPVKNIFALPKGMLLFLGIYALSFPLFLVEHLTFQSAVIQEWVAMSPALVWKGELWRIVTYELFAGSVLPWAVNLFWLITLVLILARDWSSTKFWTYCLVAAIGGAVPIVLLRPQLSALVFGGGAVVFALLVAWDHLYRRERLIMLGLGEMSVRQAAIIIAVINLVIVFFTCGGWLMTLSFMCGGAAGWLYLVIGRKRIMSRHSQVTESARIARLEL
jgi:membrane associated rhomboid family serine protease